jgi:glutamate N-acetyltransferase/amino-acid N-acetyltransferase
MEFQWLDSPSITSPLGWSAGAVYSGMKTYGSEPRFDLGVLASDRPCAVAGVYTQNRICGAPVTLTRSRVEAGVAQALVVNSGCSNVGMGQRGLEDAERMTALAAMKLGLDPKLVLVGSTGVIGRPIPIDSVERNMARLEVSADGGSEFSRAMMTTDTVEKVRALTFEHAGERYTVAGTAKGSGMAHPNMATVFCFLTTDAAVDSSWLHGALRRIVDQSINMVDVDMDTSTSDMMLALANGAKSSQPLTGEGAEKLEAALLQVSIALAKDLARDGEGATTMIQVDVSGAATQADARVAARTVVSSPLVKTMVTGRDPNLGRVLMAVGRSGAELALDRLCVWIGEYLAFENGQPTELQYEVISEQMRGQTVTLSVDLGVGQHRATAWGCNLTKEYVSINADYTT